ncbi:MAG: class I SAM-dependent DNA methyltransferase [Planctomycetia bacterium]|nr:class I SAM-dependent DNA methyltransferase [Planctomycetia bacterium]
MDKQQAKQIIQETVENPFDKGRFTLFIKNLLNHIEENRIPPRHGQFIPDAYKPYISSLARIGKFNDNENRVDILIIKLQKETSLERARTMQRNFVAGYLQGKYGSSNEKEAALVAFVSPDSADWRFSLVKMDYKFEQTQAGRMKVKEEFTPARRWSFLVGANETSHTAQSRLVNMLANDEHNPTLKELEQAFDIETVTKEFFIKYRDLFIRTKEELDKVVKSDAKIKADFEAKGVNTVDFAKKLLGQIVFLYFLQKKEWFGVGRDAAWGTGPKNFLRLLFEKNMADYKNFFNDILEPLFYEALAIERTNDFYSRFNCKIPFLNGGLFDPINSYDWVHTDIILPNELFSNKEKTKEGDIGTGIFDVFDRYNFTVREDEPLEKEVAIDPEMLGKVFENLLEVKDRKSKGTYYTPREIVHYMCQESLINHLDATINPPKTTVKEPVFTPNTPTQKKLFRDTKPRQLCLTSEKYQPVVPREDIESFIRHGDIAIEHDVTAKEKHAEKSDYNGKYKKYKLPETIRAHAKLIDDALADIKICDPAIGSGAFPVGMMHEIVRARQTLTTYLGNTEERTLYNFKRHAIQESLYGVDIDLSAVEIAKLRLWLSLVVDEEDYQTIKPLPNLDYKIICGNSLLEVEKDLSNSELFKEMEKLKPLYFDETNIKKKKELKQKIDSLIGGITENNKLFDFEVYFSEVFHKKGGFDVVIANPPYGAEIDKITLKKIKQNLSDTNNSNSAAIFIDYGKNRVIGERGTLTFIVPKSLLYSENWFSLVNSMLGNTHILVDVEKAFEKVKLEQVVFVYSKSIHKKEYLARKFLDNDFIRSTNIFNDLVLKYKAWICDVSPEELNIGNNLKIDCVYMKDISETKRGVGLQKYLSNDGDHPVIGGKNIFRYGCNGVKGYLSKEILKSNRNKLAFMQRPKIISQDLVAHIQNPIPRIMITSFYDGTGKIIGLDTVQNTIITDSNYDHKYILALLNSTFVSWYTYKFIYCAAIRTMHFDNYYVGKIPIPKISHKDQRPVTILVDQILAANQECPDADTSALERQIDQMVYKLYDLTPEEIAIVEGEKKI